MSRKRNLQQSQYNLARGQLPSDDSRLMDLSNLPTQRFKDSKAVVGVRLRKKTNLTFSWVFGVAEVGLFDFMTSSIMYL